MKIGDRLYKQFIKSKNNQTLIYSKKAGKTNSSSSLLINQKPVTNQKDMAEHFNIFSHPLVKIFKKVVSNRATQDTFSSLK